MQESREKEASSVDSNDDNTSNKSEALLSDTQHPHLTQKIKVKRSNASKQRHTHADHNNSGSASQNSNDSHKEIDYSKLHSQSKDAISNEPESPDVYGTNKAYQLASSKNTNIMFQNNQIGIESQWQSSIQIRNSQSSIKSSQKCVLSGELPENDNIKSPTHFFQLSPSQNSHLEEKNNSKLNEIGKEEKAFSSKSENGRASGSSSVINELFTSARELTGGKFLNSMPRYYDSVSSKSPVSNNEQVGEHEKSSNIKQQNSKFSGGVRDKIDYDSLSEGGKAERRPPSGKISIFSISNRPKSEAKAKISAFDTIKKSLEKKRVETASPMKIEAAPANIIPHNPANVTQHRPAIQADKVIEDDKSVGDSSRMKYTVAEDLTIIVYVNSKGGNSALSRTFWRRAVENDNLLNQKRSIDSLRERYRTQLVFLAGEDIFQMRKWIAAHGEKGHIVFKTITVQDASGNFVRTKKLDKIESEQSFMQVTVQLKDDQPSKRGQSPINVRSHSKSPDELQRYRIEPKPQYFQATKTNLSDQNKRSTNKTNDYSLLDDDDDEEENNNSSYFNKQREIKNRQEQRSLAVLVKTQGLRSQTGQFKLIQTRDHHVVVALFLLIGIQIQQKENHTMVWMS